MSHPVLVIDFTAPFSMLSIFKKKRTKSQTNFFTCFMMILDTSLTVSDGHQFSPWVHIATHSSLCMGQSPLYTKKTGSRLTQYLTRTTGAKVNAGHFNAQTPQPQCNSTNRPYLTVNIAVVGLFTFTALKKVFSPVKM